MLQQLQRILSTSLSQHLQDDRLAAAQACLRSGLADMLAALDCS